MLGGQRRRRLGGFLQRADQPIRIGGGALDLGQEGPLPGGARGPERRDLAAGGWFQSASTSAAPAACAVSGTSESAATTEAVTRRRCMTRRRGSIRDLDTIIRPLPWRAGKGGSQSLDRPAPAGDGGGNDEVRPSAPGSRRSSRCPGRGRCTWWPARTAPCAAPARAPG